MNDAADVLPGCTVIPPTEKKAASGNDAESAHKPKTRRDAGDRFGTLNAFADFGARLVGTTAQACWWIIYRETKPDGLARIAHRRIAECIGTSRYTVLRALTELQKAGLLTVVSRGRFRGAPSAYRVRAVSPDR